MGNASVSLIDRMQFVVPLGLIANQTTTIDNMQVRLRTICNLVKPSVIAIDHYPQNIRLQLCRNTPMVERRPQPTAVRTG